MQRFFYSDIRRITGNSEIHFFVSIGSATLQFLSLVAIVALTCSTCRRPPQGTQANNDIRLGENCQNPLYNHEL